MQTRRGTLYMIVDPLIYDNQMLGVCWRAKKRKNNLSQETIIEKHNVVCLKEKLQSCTVVHSAFEFPQ